MIINTCNGTRFPTSQSLEIEIKVSENDTRNTGNRLNSKPAPGPDPDYLDSRSTLGNTMQNSFWSASWNIFTQGNWILLLDLRLYIILIDN